MTLEEAITHAIEVAEDNEINAENQNPMFPNNIDECRRCANEHRQLASWLKELKVIHDEIDNMSDYDEIFIGYLRKKINENILG